MPQVTLNTTITPKSREWHLRRKEYINGTDVGVILGVNNYKTPYDLQQEKLSDDIVVIDSSEKMNMGAILEPLINQLGLDRMGGEFIENEYFNGIISDCGLFAGSPDNIWTEDGYNIYVIENKSMGGYFSSKSLSENLIIYQYQPLHYCYILNQVIKRNKLNYNLVGYKFLVLADNELHIDSYDYGDEVQDMYGNHVVPILEDFWNRHIINREEVELINDDYRKVSVIDPEKIRDANDEVRLIFSYMDKIDKMLDEKREEMVDKGLYFLSKTSPSKLLDDMKNAIKNYIGDAVYLFDGMKEIAKFNTVDKRGARRLHIHKDK